MKLRFLLGTTIATALAASGLGQTLPEQTTAAGIAGGLATKAAPNGLNALKKAKLVRAKADARLGDYPTSGPQYAEPFMPKAKAGAMTATGGVGQPGLAGAPAPAAQVPVAPWQWKLKGVATGSKGRIAAFESPDGRIVWVKVGESLDGRSKVLSISRYSAMLRIDNKPVNLRPW